MEKNILMNEIKLIELKLNLLKAKIKTITSADLYGLLKNSDDITPEDIDAIKVRMKEYTA